MKIVKDNKKNIVIAKKKVGLVIGYIAITSSIFSLISKLFFNADISMVAILTSLIIGIIFVADC